MSHSRCLLEGRELVASMLRRARNRFAHAQPVFRMYSAQTLVGAWQASREADLPALAPACAALPPPQAALPAHAGPLLRVGLVSASTLAEAAASYAGCMAATSAPAPTPTPAIALVEAAAPAALDLRATAHTARAAGGGACAHAPAAGGAPACREDRGKRATPAPRTEALCLGDPAAPFPSRCAPVPRPACFEATSLPLPVAEASIKLAPPGAAHGQLSAAAAASTFPREAWRIGGRRIFSDDA